MTLDKNILKWRPLFNVSWTTVPCHSLLADVTGFVEWWRLTLVVALRKDSNCLRHPQRRRRRILDVFRRFCDELLIDHVGTCYTKHTGADYVLPREKPTHRSEIQMGRNDVWRVCPQWYWRHCPLWGYVHNDIEVTVHLKGMPTTLLQSLSITFSHFIHRCQSWSFHVNHGLLISIIVFLPVHQWSIIVNEFLINVEYCLIIYGCQLTSMIALEFFWCSSYLSVRGVSDMVKKHQVISHCQSLSLIVNYCKSFPIIINCHHSLSIIGNHCQSFITIVNHCHSLSISLTQIMRSPPLSMNNKSSFIVNHHQLLSIMTSLALWPPLQASRLGPKWQNCS